MLSKKEVYTKLRDRFIALRLDWEQGNHYKDRFGFILGTGDQLILSPTGKTISPPDAKSGDASRMFFGRHGCDTTGEVLDTILAPFPAKTNASDLQLEWFLWRSKPARRPGGSYPASPEAIAGFARMPIATIEGPVPEALKNPGFLRWHVRQFIWEQGPASGPGSIRVRRVRDGLPGGLPTEIERIPTDGTTMAKLGHALDEAWNTYMKDRPLVARGYLENEHGKWMRGIGDQLIFEDEEVRLRARQSTLLPPGRLPGQNAPYADQHAP